MLKVKNVGTCYPKTDNKRPKPTDRIEKGSRDVPAANYDPPDNPPKQPTGDKK